MKQQHLIRLAGLLVILLGIAYFAGVFDREISTIDVPALAIDAEAVQAIRVEGNQIIALENSGGHWQLTEPMAARADSLTVRQLLTTLGDLSLASVVSNNPDRYAHYGVDTTARTLTLTLPEGATTLILSQDGPDFQSLYARLEGDPRVFSTRGRPNLPDVVDRWRDKQILKIPALQVPSARIDRAVDGFEVRYDSTGWMLVRGTQKTAADSTAVVRWLRRFAPLRATGFDDVMTPSAVQENMTHRIAFTLPGRVAETLWLAERDADLALTNGKTVFTLTASQLATLAPPSATFEQQ